jgi:hypothetical protein
MSSGVHCGIVERSVVVGVGRADVGLVAPRHHEHRPLVLRDRHHRGDLVAHLVPRHRDVDALGRADRVGRLGPLAESPHPIGPHPGGADHRRGPDLEHLAVDLDLHAVECTGRVVVEARDRRPVDHDRAVVERRGASDREGESGIVGRGVVVEVGAGQPLGGQRGHVPQTHPRCSAACGACRCGPAGEVVHPHRLAERPGQLPVEQPVAGEDREEERQDPHQVGALRRSRWRSASAW